MVRVLQIFPQMNNAGTEKVIMNLYENINREKIQFDFLLNKKGELDEKIMELGGKIFYVENKGKKDYYNKLLDFFNNNKYTIIHVHTQGGMESILKAAKESNVNCRIIHSHNSRQDLPAFLKLLKLPRNLKIEKYATDFLACSTESAKWLFPTKYKETKIVYNAIDIEKYCFDKEIRKKVRKYLNIKEEQKVILNVGRFAKQKNHIRLVKIAKKLVQLEPSVKFVLIGTGPLEYKIKNLTNKYKLQNHFLFLGNRKDVNELLMAGDLFLFPTLHEGLGIVAVEAQFSGLECIASEGVPKEANVGGKLLTRISLKKSNKIWCEKILLSLDKSIDRKRINQNNRNSRYNINIIAKDIENYYLNKV